MSFCIYEIITIQLTCWWNNNLQIAVGKCFIVDKYQHLSTQTSWIGGEKIHIAVRLSLVEYMYSMFRSQTLQIPQPIKGWLTIPKVACVSQSDDYRAKKEPIIVQFGMSADWKIGFLSLVAKEHWGKACK